MGPIPLSTRVSYLLCHRVLPVVDVAEDVALSLINALQAGAMGCVDCVDNGVFIHQKLEGT